MKAMNAEEALRLLLEPGQVTELRAFVPNGRGFVVTHAGYFDDVPALAAAAAKLDGMKAHGVYFIPNPVQSALLARANNRTRPMGKGDPLTTNEEVERRRWLLLDLDPKRPKGISSTDAEKAAADAKARSVAAYLEHQGWPAPVVADSGNGFHLMYRIDLPAEDGGLCERATKALAARFSDEAVTLDEVVHNAARIWKLYGTTARKGDPTADRPHRMARLLSVPDVRAAVTSDQLEALAGQHGDPPAIDSTAGAYGGSGRRDAEEVRRVLRAIPPRRSYDEWIRIIAGVLDGCEGNAREAEALLKEWSPEEAEGEYADKLRHALKRVRFGSVVCIAERYGFDPTARRVQNGIRLGPLRETTCGATPAPEARFRHGTAGGNTDSEEGLPALPQRAYDLLPGLLSEGCRCFRQWYERDVFLSGALGTCSALLPKVRFRYGKEYLSPHLFCFVLAKAGRGKGALKYALSLADGVDALLLEEYRQERSDWEERKRAYEQHRRGRKKDEAMPEPPGPEPPEVLLRAAEDTTLPALYKTLEANPEGVLIGATEADILSQANRRREFGGFSALFRQAFHHESGQKSTKSEGTVRVREPRIALVLSGTNDQFAPLVESVENGLFSRFAVYRFQAPLRYQSQRPRPEDDAFEAYLERTRARLSKLYQDLRSRERPLYVDTPAALWDRIDGAFEGLFNRVLKDAGAPDDLAASVFRAAVIAFRIAAVLCVLRRFDEGKDLASVQCLDVGEADVEAAIALALVYVEQGMRQALQMLETTLETNETDAKTRTLHALSQTGGARRMTGKQRAFLDALPAAFERKEAVAVGLAQGANERTVDKWLRKFSEGEAAVFDREDGFYERKAPAHPGGTGGMGSSARVEPETAVLPTESPGGRPGGMGGFEHGGTEATRRTAHTAHRPNGQDPLDQPGNGETAHPAHSAHQGRPSSSHVHPDGAPEGDGLPGEVPVDFIFTDDAEDEAPF